MWFWFELYCGFHHKLLLAGYTWKGGMLFAVKQSKHKHSIIASEDSSVEACPLVEQSLPIPHRRCLLRLWKGPGRRLGSGKGSKDWSLPCWGASNWSRSHSSFTWSWLQGEGLKRAALLQSVHLCLLQGCPEIGPWILRRPGAALAFHARFGSLLLLAGKGLMASLA